MLCGQERICSILTVRFLLHNTYALHIASREYTQKTIVNLLVLWLKKSPVALKPATGLSFTFSSRLFTHRLDHIVFCYDMVISRFIFT